MIFVLSGLSAEAQDLITKLLKKVSSLLFQPNMNLQIIFVTSIKDCLGFNVCHCHETGK